MTGDQHAAAAAAAAAAGGGGGGGVAPSLFDTLRDQLPQAYVERDEAMGRAQAHADNRFVAEAETIIRRWAHDRPDGFTTDLVWNELEMRGVPCREPRALGPVVMRLSRKGVIRQTGRTVPSVRRHASPIPVWIGYGHLDPAEEPVGRGERARLVGLRAFVEDRSNDRQAILDRLDFFLQNP